VSKPDYREELASFFGSLPVQTLIQRLEPLKTNRVEIHDIEPLQTLVRGRVALGDAAHSTAPDLGQGGCQAMEDASPEHVSANHEHQCGRCSSATKPHAKIALPT